ncbi:MAG: HAMP domain-containing sensor histidine kinase [Ruthenibacterium sp.]
MKPLRSAKAAQGAAKKPRPQRLISIRWELTLFIVLLCVLLVGLVWLLNVQLLEPTYNATIRRSLSHTADVYAALIEKYGVLEDPSAANGIDPAFYAEINSMPNAEALLSGKCLDISGANGLNLLHSHQLTGACALHPAQTGLFGDERGASWNTRYTVALRQMILTEGDTSFTLTDTGKPQMVFGKNVANRYVVLVSTDLERIGEAAAIISLQMRRIAVLVLVLGVLGAFWFSRWFARPLSEISGAARAVAAGNYSVRVQKHTSDEIGRLADDFNTMAGEVGRSAQLQRDLIANISHDLRTPLTLIKGYAETVRDLTGEDKQKREEQLSVIVDETDRLSALVNSVMELSKMSSGAEKPARVHFDLAQLCDEVAQRYADVCAKNGYTLSVQADVPCAVDADPDLLSRVIHNLLSNALHHVGADGYLAVRCLPEAGGGARVEVCDHGEGISPEDLPSIFDKYYRTRASAGKPGTGLGLSITKAILQGHGFDFGVQSEVGRGSTFWFRAK